MGLDAHTDQVLLWHYPTERLTAKLIPYTPVGPHLTALEDGTCIVSVSLPKDETTYFLHSSAFGAYQEAPPTPPNPPAPPATPPEDPAVPDHPPIPPLTVPADVIVEAIARAKAQVESLGRRFRTAEEARDQLEYAVRIYLEAGPAADPAPSTIVDVTGDVPRVLRAGAIPFEKLRDVVPDLVDGQG